MVAWQKSLKPCTSVHWQSFLTQVPWVMLGLLSHWDYKCFHLGQYNPNMKEGKEQQVLSLLETRLFLIVKDPASLSKKNLRM